MLAGATEYPNAGSYALLLCPAPPGTATAGWGPQQEEIKGPQLVRIIRTPINPDGLFLVSLPLVDGASGTKAVPADELIDATPLTGAEGKEMVELARELTRKRLRDRAGKKARHDALRHRAIWSPMLLSKLKELRAREARQAA